MSTLAPSTTWTVSHPVTDEGYTTPTPSRNVFQLRDERTLKPLGLDTTGTGARFCEPSRYLQDVAFQSRKLTDPRAHHEALTYCVISDGETVYAVDQNAASKIVCHGVDTSMDAIKVLDEFADSGLELSMSTFRFAGDEPVVLETVNRERATSMLEWLLTVKRVKQSKTGQVAKESCGSVGDEADGDEEQASTAFVSQLPLPAPSIVAPSEEQSVLATQNAAALSTLAERWQMSASK